MKHIYLFLLALLVVCLAGAAMATNMTTNSENVQPVIQAETAVCGATSLPWESEMFPWESQGWSRCYSDADCGKICPSGYGRCAPNGNCLCPY